MNQRRWSRIGLFLLLALALPKCAILSQRYAEPNQAVNVSMSGGFRIQLLSKAKVGVEQRLSVSCRQNKQKDNRWSLVKTETRKPVKLIPTCDSTGTKIVAWTKDILPAGKYEFKIKNSSSFKGSPVYKVLYQDPNFAGGTDRVYAGAVPLSEGQNISGTVNYNAGNQTRWMHLKGEGGLLSLIFLAPEQSSALTADVFKLVPGIPTLVRVTSLFPGKEKRFVLRNNNLYVRLQSKIFANASDYTVIRKDISSSSPAVLPIIDLYSVGPSKSIVLLKISDGMKLGDSVTISGKTAKGTSQYLGACTVTSIGNKQVSCALPRVPGAGLVSYEAVFSQQG